MGFCLRIDRVWLESAWFDEIFSILFLGSEKVRDAMRVFQDGNPQVQPLYAFVLFCYTRVTGTHEIYLRMFSIAFSLIAIVQTYLIGARLYDRVAGIVAAGFISLTAYFVYYSQEIRMYSMLTVWTLLSVYCFIRLIEGGGKRWYAGGVGTTLLIVWTHAAGAFALIPQGLIVMAAQRLTVVQKAAWFILHFAACATLYFWWRGADQTNVQSATTDQPPPLLIPNDEIPIAHTLAGTIWSWSSGVIPPHYSGFWQVLSVACHVALMVALIMGLVMAIVRRVRSRREPNAPALTLLNTEFLLLWAVVPPVTLFLLSRFGGLDYFLRYSMNSAIPMYILTGIAVSRYTSGMVRWGIVALLIAMPIYRIQGYTRPLRIPWKPIVEQVAEEVGRGSELLVYHSVEDTIYLETAAIEFHGYDYGITADFVFGPGGIERIIDEAESNESARAILSLGSEKDELDAQLKSIDAPYECYTYDALHHEYIGLYIIDAR